MSTSPSGTQLWILMSSAEIVPPTSLFSSQTSVLFL
ncbi:predicted protein [Botrytis cinerea T4]|uniref:Uncharacterized protein n=1 Tax=Botryotinia fuckeliana (strain T4) TaxID=999810 RepID=G2Y088_BOTF4|nr:predicted protein [Botrytis cinerea T4]